MKLKQIHPIGRAAVLLLSSCALALGQANEDEGAAKKARFEKETPDRKEGEHGKEGDAKGMADRMAEAKKKLEALERDGRKEEAEALRRSLSGARDDGRTEKPEVKRMHAEGPARLRHLQEAIKHLREGGFHEPADHLQGLAKQMHAELNRHEANWENTKEKKEITKGEKESGGKGDDLHAMRAQMQKLSHQVEELRAQLSKLQGSIEGNRQ